METTCLNCNTPIGDSIKYCPSCGQKTNFAPLSLWSILKDFFSNLFNLENKIWSTLKDIWIPGKLSLAYIKGERTKYYNPIRIFLVVLFAFFALVLLHVGDEVDELNTFSEEQRKGIWEDELSTRFDSLAACHYSIENADAFKDELLYIEYESDSIDVKEVSENVNEELEDVKEILEEDDMDEEIQDEGNDIIEIDNNSTKISFKGFGGVEVEQKGVRKRNNDFTLFDGIKASDFFRLDADELKEKHGGDHWIKDLALTQGQKIMKDFAGSIKFLISNGTWAIIASILFMALVFKLLYLRHNYLYAEHFIFHLYGHTRMLLISIVLLLLAHFFSVEGGNSFMANLIWFGAGAGYLFFGMRRFYESSGAKLRYRYTFTLLMAYPFIISLCIFLILLLSFVFL
jgi:hypothetical protein